MPHPHFQHQGGTLIENYQAVRSTREIAKSIACYLEMSDPANYPPSDRAKTVRAVNDILQGSPSLATDKLLAELVEKGGSYYAGEIKSVKRDILAFQAQKRRIGHPYTKTSGKQYHYRLFERDGHPPLKIVNQRLFDWAAKAGFPPDFFENTCFDHVTVYCMPDYTHCSGSVFRDCTFSVCRMVGTHFEDASLYSCEFHSCCLSGAVFSDSTLANTHFYDCVQHRGGFIRTHLNRCRMLDCLMTGATFAESTLDGCSFDRVRANRIRGLHTATITQGGATEDECRRNREAIYKALRPEDYPQGPDRRRPAPER